MKGPLAKVIQESKHPDIRGCSPVAAGQLHSSGVSDVIGPIIFTGSALFRVARNISLSSLISASSAIILFSSSSIHLMYLISAKCPYADRCNCYLTKQVIAEPPIQMILRKLRPC